MAEAVRLRRQVPARSAAQIVEIIARAHGVQLAERTVREHLSRSGVSRAAISADPVKAFGRYEASRRNEIWIGDVLIGRSCRIRACRLQTRQALCARGRLFRLLVAGGG